jgi:hypothetical protein
MLRALFHVHLILEFLHFILKGPELILSCFLVFNAHVSPSQSAHFATIRATASCSHTDIGHSGNILHNTLNLNFRLNFDFPCAVFCEIKNQLSCQT